MVVVFQNLLISWDVHIQQSLEFDIKVQKQINIQKPSTESQSCGRKCLSGTNNHTMDRVTEITFLPILKLDVNFN